MDVYVNAGQLLLVPTSLLQSLISELCGQLEMPQNWNQVQHGHGKSRAAMTKLLAFLAKRRGGSFLEIRKIESMKTLGQKPLDWSWPSVQKPLLEIMPHQRCYGKNHSAVTLSPPSSSTLPPASDLPHDSLIRQVYWKPPWKSINLFPKVRGQR